MVRSLTSGSSPLQERYTLALLKELGAINFPPERCFSMTVSGKPKTTVLRELMDLHPDAKLHFVEDKLGTLDKVWRKHQCNACAPIGTMLRC